MPFSVIIFRRTGSGLFAYLSRDFEKLLEQIVSLGAKTLGTTNLVVPRHIKNEKFHFWLTSVAQNVSAKTPSL